MSCACHVIIKFRALCSEVASTSGHFNLKEIFTEKKILLTSTSISKQGEFNKTIIPFALVGYEIGYSQLGASRLVGYLPSHIQRAVME